MTDLDPLDSIDKSIDIDASAERVFALVARPGWWINDGERIDPNPTLRTEDGFTIVTHAEYGEFTFETLVQDPPRRVTHRWLHKLPDDGVERSTQVTFHITDRPGGGVVLRVIESGFSKLDKPRAEWLTDRSNNDKGWDAELAAAKAFAEAS